MRLIDKEALKRDFAFMVAGREAKSSGGFISNIFGMIEECFLDLLEEQPTIEAKPIVHAHWNADGRCTNCGGHAPFFAYADDWFETKYCPHCGAQMDEFAGDINVGNKTDHIAGDGKKEND